MFRIATLFSLLFTVNTAFLLVFLSLSSGSQTSEANSECARSCGNINISSPFRLPGDPGHCGNKSYELSCEADGTSSQSHHTILKLFSGKYYVQAINYNNYTIRLVDAGVHHKTTDNNFSNPVYPLTVFNFTYNNYNNPYSLSYPTAPLVFLICNNPMSYSDLFVETASCINNTTINSSPDSTVSTYSYIMIGGLPEDHGKPIQISPPDLGSACKIALMVLAFPPTPTDKYNMSCQEIYRKLAYGFELSWLDYICTTNCGDSQCMSNYIKTGDNCPPYMEPDEMFKMMKNQIQGFFNTLLEIKLSLGIPCMIAFIIYNWRRRHLSMYGNIEAFLRGNINLMPERFSYSDIKKMTNGFKDKLGEGSFGTVYKAKLRRGRPVAIKMLKTTADGQDFINEVATIGMIHHVNVVRLIGFCIDHSHRALVYDFMSNGSLEKYIFSRQGAISLSCEKIFEIAVGVARGIQYLHQGCDMRILHFDLKPHNILLDENFTPKVSDFGLARSYPMDNSIVSMTAARGTIGYMAPELFYENIGGVSYKADVYSFGMLMLEMAGRRKNLNAAIDRSSELSQIYFPTWVSDQLIKGKEIEIGDATEDEMKIIKKMIIVALWCIQMKPVERPSMSKVVEMLEGELESLQVPPKPFLYPQQIPADDVENITACSSTMTESTEINLIADAI